MHHITVYACYGEISDDSEAWDCLWEVMPDQHKCTTLLFVWAVGGNVGIKYNINCRTVQYIKYESFYGYDAFKSMIICVFIHTFIQLFFKIAETHCFELFYSSHFTSQSTLVCPSLRLDLKIRRMLG